MEERQLTNRELWHHGIKGQRWGVRRFQNEDGSLTEAGKKRYFYGYEGEINNRRDYKKAIKGAKEVYKYNKDFMDNEFGKKNSKPYKQYEKGVYKEGVKEIKDEYKNTQDYKNFQTALKVGAAAAATGLAAYGAYKLVDTYKESKKSKAFTTEELKAMDIQVFEPERFEPDRIEIDRVEPERINLNNDSALEIRNRVQSRMKEKAVQMAKDHHRVMANEYKRKADKAKEEYNNLKKQRAIAADNPNLGLNQDFFSSTLRTMKSLEADINKYTDLSKKEFDKTNGNISEEEIEKYLKSLR